MSEVEPEQDERAGEPVISREPDNLQSELPRGAEIPDDLDPLAIRDLDHKVARRELTLNPINRDSRHGVAQSQYGPETGAPKPASPGQPRYDASRFVQRS